jgi:hypothetical protein
VMVKGWEAVLTPFPVKATAAGDACALLESETLPAAVPVLEGVKLTARAVEPPGATVSGAVIPETV